METSLRDVEFRDLCLHAMMVTFAKLAWMDLHVRLFLGGLIRRPLKFV